LQASFRSANILSGRLFELKGGIELNTREFMLFTPSQINPAFADCGFIVQKRPQLLLPMVLHRRADRCAPRA